MKFGFQPKPLGWHWVQPVDVKIAAMTDEWPNPNLSYAIGLGASKQAALYAMLGGANQEVFVRQEKIYPFTPL